jgi:excisionase family DNA binding protein
VAVNVDDLPLTLTVKETAEVLRVSERTVFKLLAAEELRSVQVRGSRRITRQAIADYLTSLERVAEA